MSNSFLLLAKVGKQTWGKAQLNLPSNKNVSFGLYSACIEDKAMTLYAISDQIVLGTGTK